METTKFLVEFFFDDFWHWLGLVCLVAAMTGAKFMHINVGRK